MTLREQGVSYFTIKSSVAPIFTFYKLNYVSLNRANIARYYGKIKKVVRDKAYSTEDIQKALQNADARMRMIILLLSSTACRVGALPELTLGHLTRLPDHNMYKIVFYEGTNNEYITIVLVNVQLQGLTTIFYIGRDAVKGYHLMNKRRDGNRRILPS
jgi:hypothetical protein